MKNMITSSFSTFKKLFAAIALIAALAAPAVSAGDQVPYKGAAAGKVLSREDINGGVPIPGGPAFRRVVSQAVGNFSHVGKSTVDLYQEVRLIIENGVPFLIIEGTYVVTAANGDTITGPYFNKQNFITGAFTSDVIITGGTGRFAGATGATSGAGQFNPDDTFSYFLEGTISSVGSNKK